MATTLDKGNVDSFIPTIVAQDALNKLSAPINLTQFINKDFSLDLANAGDTVRVAKTGALSVNDKAANTEVTKQAPDDSAITVSLDKHKEVTFLVEDIAQIQSRPDVIQEYLQDAVLEIMEQMEKDGFVIAQSLTGTVTGTAYESNLELADVRVARKDLTDNRAPVSGRALFLDTTQYNVLLGTNDISYLQNYGSNVAVADGRVPTLYGFEVYESLFVQNASSPVAGVDNIAMHRNALTMVARALPTYGNGQGVRQTLLTRDGMPPIRITQHFNADLLGLQVTVDALYGHAVLRNELGTRLLS